MEIQQRQRVGSGREGGRQWRRREDFGYYIRFGYEGEWSNTINSEQTHYALITITIIMISSSSSTFFLFVGCFAYVFFLFVCSKIYIPPELHLCWSRSDAEWTGVLLCRSRWWWACRVSWSRFGEQCSAAVVVFQVHVTLWPQQLDVTRVFSLLSFHLHHGRQTNQRCQRLSYYTQSEGFDDTMGVSWTPPPHSSRIRAESTTPTKPINTLANDDWFLKTKK